MTAFYETNREWMDQAACTGTDPEIFFPNTGAGRHGVPAMVVAICSNCPVMQRCADYADATGVTFGIWGGMNTEQRHRRARKRLEAAQ